MVIAEGRHGGDLGRYLLDGDAVGVVIEMAGEAQAMTIRRRVGLRVVMTTGERKYILAGGAHVFVSTIVPSLWYKIL